MSVQLVLDLIETLTDGLTNSIVAIHRIEKVLAKKFFGLEFVLKFSFELSGIGLIRTISLLL